MTTSSLAAKKSPERQHQAERGSPEPSRQPGPDGPYANIMTLQRTAGNWAVSQFLGSVSSTAPSNGGVLQRKCASCALAGGECAECRKEKTLQRSPFPSKGEGWGEGKTIPPIVHEVLRSPGQPLDSVTRVFMESHFDHDFSQVRVHTDAKAAESARAVNALAYTVGRNIVFGSGQHAPETSQGKRLLAHELTHVAQQSSVGSQVGIQRLGDGEDRYEHEAEAVAAQVATAAPPLVIRPSVSPVGSASLAIMRAPDECQTKCEKQFNRCIAHTTFPPQCVAERSVCQQGCASTPKAEAPATAPPPPVNLSTMGADAFEPGIVSAKDVKNDPKWVENDIAGDQLSDKAPWTYTLTYKDGSKLVIPLEQVFMERLQPATVTVFRKQKASGRIVPCVLAQSDPRLRALKGPTGGDFSAVAALATPRFDSTTAPKIVSLVNAAQMLFLGKGMLEVLQVQAMNPLMGGGMGAAGRAGGGSAARVGAGAAAKRLGGAAAKKGLTFVEIGAGDLKASLELAKKGGVKVIAVDPAAPAAAAVKELEGLGGQFVKGVAADVAPGTADHVFQYFPWRVGEAGSTITGGTWRLVEDTVRLLKPNGAAHFVTEHVKTAEYLAGEATRRGLRAVITETTAGAAAPGAAGAGVPSFSKALKVWMVNIYK